MDEIGSRYSALFQPVVFFAISILEGDRGILDIDDAMVGDGDAVGVPSEVVEDFFGTGKRLLGIDHPIMVIKPVNKALYAFLRLMLSCLCRHSRQVGFVREFKLFLGEKLFQSINEFSAEDLGESLDRE